MYDASRELRQLSETQNAELYHATKLLASGSEYQGKSIPHGTQSDVTMKRTSAPGPSYSNPPPFRKQPPETAADNEPLRAHLNTLSHEELLERCLANEMRLVQWEKAASSLVTSLTLTPEMTEAFYARSLRELLSSALDTLDVVEELRHVECSMPCVKGEAPRISLVMWRDLSYSEWHVEWSPASWWVSVSAVGYRWGLSFNCLTNVAGIQLDGIIRCSFSNDMTALRIGFPQKPMLNMTVESSVGWGAVPIPVREQIEYLVRTEIEQFVENRLTGSNDMVVVLKTKMEEKLSDSDLNEAKRQAERAANVNLRSPTFL